MIVPHAKALPLVKCESAVGFSKLPTTGSTEKLNEHFQEHGGDFGSADANHYEQAAIAFLSGPVVGTVQQCCRSGGDIVRFDPSTDFFGVLGDGNVIRTFYKPIKCSLVPASVRARVRARGRCHDHPDNLVYFRVSCTQH